MSDHEIDERDIRLWFMKTDLEQAEDTFRVVEGIIETRKEFQPKRKQRADKGTKRINLKEEQERDGTYEQPDLR